MHPDPVFLKVNTFLMLECANIHDEELIHVVVQRFPSLRDEAGYLADGAAKAVREEWWRRACDQPFTA